MSRYTNNLQKLPMSGTRPSMTSFHISPVAEGLIFDLVWFHGISTFVGYLIPNPFSCKQLVLFQTIQFSMSTQFVKNIPISNYSVYSSSYI